jgi:flagellar biosynthesis protein FlhG
LAGDKPKRPKSAPRKRRKLGRGLSEVSHIFLSGAEKAKKAEEAQKADEIKQARETGQAREVEKAREAEQARGEEPRILSFEDVDEPAWMPDANLISVTSGEKIRGKTFLSANLAFGLLAKGRTVAIVNADPVKPDILDVTGAIRSDDGNGISLSHPGFGEIPVADLYAISSGRSASGRKPRSGAVSANAAIEAAAGRAQNVVIDTSPAAETSRIIWKAAGLTLVITRATSDAMRASYLTIKRIRGESPAGRIGLVVNMVTDRAEASKCFRKISGVCRRFLKTNIRNYGYIVSSEAVAEACERATPLTQAYPGSKITKCIHSVLKLIMMDESAIARRRREVTAKACALKEGK